MKKEFSRRDFTKLTTAALGGVLAGAAVGCDKGDSGDETASADGDGGGESGGYDNSKHACRGLNECANLGASGENACAGQGSCATVSQSCGGSNGCRYQGGCGEEPANNDCAGEGGCHVPIADEEKWAKARELFEARMAEAGKEVGEAPAAG